MGPGDRRNEAKSAGLIASSYVRCAYVPDRRIAAVLETVTEYRRNYRIDSAYRAEPVMPKGSCDFSHVDLALLAQRAILALDSNTTLEL